jgi:hypothetical protein
VSVDMPLCPCRNDFVNEDGKIVSRSRVTGGVSLRRSAEQVSGKGKSEKDEQD